uniref:Peroxisomal membrane protein MPV17 n=1 Tax=Coccolithus braarudii TaxID=221442 RepID=A0A7S0QAI0_9EUKA
MASLRRMGAARLGESLSRTLRPQLPLCPRHAPQPRIRAAPSRAHSTRPSASESTVPKAAPTTEVGAIPAEAAAEAASGFSYIAFAKSYPSTNNILIAIIKTGAADLVAQMVIEQKSVSEVDWRRNMVFCLFGGVYLGAFQYWYQVNIFKRLFTNVEKFTSQPWSKKLTDIPGLSSLLVQCVMDVSIMCGVYLPTFYVFKAAVFSNVVDPVEWFHSGTTSYIKNFRNDSPDLLKLWFPADLVCFSVPLWLRLPVRHIVSFVWTTYLSLIRGSK